MPLESIEPFDAAALYVALDERRIQLGLSWKGVAEEIWNLSSELNAGRDDRPISPSTLSDMASKPRTSCQHALFMLRWLGRTPESFLRDAPEGAARPPYLLPEVGPDRRLRWALKRLFAATDEKRRAEGVTWPELAAQLGCTPSQLTGLRTARFAAGMDVAMRIVQWLGRPAADFIYAATW